MELLFHHAASDMHTFYALAERGRAKAIVSLESAALLTAAESPARPPQLVSLWRPDPSSQGRGQIRRQKCEEVY
jgi:hypothetical protein